MAAHEGKNEDVEVLEQQGVRLERTSRTVVIGGKTLRLTIIEFRLLECLLQASGKTCTRAQLVDAMNQGEALVGERTVDVHVCALRRKLQAPELIETVRRVGYRFKKV